jgi:hypothetical protein
MLKTPTSFSPKRDAPYLGSVEDFTEAETWSAIDFCDCSDPGEDVSVVLNVNEYMSIVVKDMKEKV